MIKQLLQTTLLSLNLLNAPTNNKIQKEANTESELIFSLAIGRIEKENKNYIFTSPEKTDNTILNAELLTENNQEIGTNLNKETLNYTEVNYNLDLYLNITIDVSTSTQFSIDTPGNDKQYFSINTLTKYKTPIFSQTNIANMSLKYVNIYKETISQDVYTNFYTQEITQSNNGKIKLLNEEKTGKIYKNNELIKELGQRENFNLTDFKLPEIVDDETTLDLWITRNNTDRLLYDKVEYEFTMYTQYAQYSGWQNSTQTTMGTATVNDTNTPIQIKSTIESNFIQESTYKNECRVKITHEFYLGETKKEITGLISTGDIKWVKIKGGTNQDNESEEPDIPINPDNPNGETDKYYGEIIDLPSLIFTIITLPFTFINTAFNLTLFQGTPYQINFANIISLIIGGLILIYIIKLIMQLKG